MTHEQEMLAETLVAMTHRYGEPGRIAERKDANWAFWREVEALGFPLIIVPQEAGGSGGDLADAAAMAIAAGRAAVDLPLVETALLGAWVLAEAGLPVPSGPLTVAPAGDVELSERAGGWHVVGEVERVPWGRFATAVQLIATDGDRAHVVSIPRERCAVTENQNLAMEPRDDLSFDVDVGETAVAVAPEGLDPAAIRRRGALARALTMTGALERVRELTVTYAQQREQFGRAIGSFQALQQSIAELAGEVAAATAAVNAAVAAESREPAPLAVAAAKVRTGAAAGTAARIAHQVHGAMGFTDEHELHLFTGRLWAWRDEFGPEREWAALLGSEAAACGPDAIWPDLVEPSRR